MKRYLTDAKCFRKQDSKIRKIYSRYKIGEEGITINENEIVLSNLFFSNLHFHAIDNVIAASSLNYF